MNGKMMMMNGKISHLNGVSGFLGRNFFFALFVCLSLHIQQKFLHLLLGKNGGGRGIHHHHRSICKIDWQQMAFGFIGLIDWLAVNCLWGFYFSQIFSLTSIWKYFISINHQFLCHFFRWTHTHQQIYVRRRGKEHIQLYVELTDHQLSIVVLLFFGFFHTKTHWDLGSGLHTRGRRATRFFGILSQMFALNASLILCLR